MTRDFTIPGESLVLAKFGEHIGPEFSNRPGAISNLSELGLTSEAINISPRLIHTDIGVDDYGPVIPAEVLAQLADVSFQTKLVNVDLSVLDFCISESMGGTFIGGGVAGFAGVMQPAGTPLGGYVPYLMSGYHFISLSFLCPQNNFPWHFPACYLKDNFTFPLGTKYSTIELAWRAIPYAVPLTGDQTETTNEIIGEPSDTGGTEFDNVQPLAGTVDPNGEISSSGAVLWNHLPDLA